MSNVTLVAASVVRAAFANGDFDAPDQALPSLLGGSYTVKGGFVPSETGLVRGRLHPLAIEAFNEQVKGQQYAGEKAKGVVVGGPVKTVEVPMFSAKTGRPVKSRTLPIGEVRALAGKPDGRGRISAADLLVAAKALGSGEPKAPAAKAAPKAKVTKVATVKVPATE